ncbi:methyltransferase [Streptomyces sp. 8K308]|nr:methyltransferase [Streptomyces sp. 8K308]
MGHAPPAEWARALRAVPRHLFLPDRVWLRDGEGAYARCDRANEPVRWWDAAYGDEPVVTRLSDDVPESSASAPSTVVRMLEAAEPTDSMRALEIGTGTGFNTGLLCHRLGDEHVATVELDPGLADQARANLKRAGYTPHVVCGDGALGWSDGAPYDLLIAGCSVRSLPPAWLEQVRSGGRIVAPWSSAWCPFGTLIATRNEDGTATGRFAPFGSYMEMRTRGQRADVELMRDVLRPGQRPEVSTTRVSPWAVAGHDLAAQFAIGLAVPDVWHSWDTETEEAAVRLWLAADDATSWAAVDHDGRQFRVAQFGPRRLWDEVATAWQRWDTQARPAVDRFGLTATPDGSSFWLDSPG